MLTLIINIIQSLSTVREILSPPAPRPAAVSSVTGGRPRVTAIFYPLRLFMHDRFTGPTRMQVPLTNARGKMASARQLPAPETDSDDDAGAGPSNGKDGEAIVEPDVDLEASAEKKRRRPNVHREWEEINRWLRDDFGDDRIRQLINGELQELAKQAGGFDSLRRQNRVMKSSEWQEWCFRRKYTNNDG